MTQVSKHIPRTPKQAARRYSAIDRALNPELFKALGDPSRLMLLSCIAKCSRACSVTEVAECCAIDFSVVSRHLALLARAGILSAEKRGRTVFYTFQSGTLSARLRQLADAIDELANKRGECCEQC